MATRLMQFWRTRSMIALLAVALSAGMLALAPPAAAQTTPGSGAPAVSSPSSSPGSSPGSAASPPASSSVPMQAVPEDSSGAAAQSVVLSAQPTAVTSGKADWDTGYAAIRASFDKIRAALKTADVKEAGRPFAVFTQTDDKGFSYDAMIPVTAPPSTATQLGTDVKFGVSPAGKALKFQHRGAYDDIDATYEAITAYLDEKGLEAKDFFIEEYMSDTPRSDDTTLAVDIYVFLQ